MCLRLVYIVSSSSLSHSYLWASILCNHYHGQHFVYGDAGQFCVLTANPDSHNIAQIRRYLTHDATAILIHSLVTSRLDNINSLLHGLPDYQLYKLQCIQNHAAKVVVRKKIYNH